MPPLIWWLLGAGVFVGGAITGVVAAEQQVVVLAGGPPEPAPGIDDPPGPIVQTQVAQPPEVDPWILVGPVGDPEIDEAEAEEGEGLTEEEYPECVRWDRKRTSSGSGRYGSGRHKRPSSGRIKRRK